MQNPNSNDNNLTNTNSISEQKESRWNLTRNNLIHKLIGVLLILVALIVFVLATIWIVISKVQKFDTQEYGLINFIIKDRHYGIAIPLLIPVTFIVFYLRWISFNYFKYC